jgi:EAL domain-containing protein (putative c-di-GMP-specific phosphodiesterase class I)
MTFIPAAEESGLIVPLGKWVLETACRQNKAWQEAGYPPVPVAVNVSERQIADGALADTVEEVLKATGMEPRYLELEITESTAMKNLDNSVAVLSALYDMGVRVVIDDFGAGYSALSRLKALPIHALKIDRFFIQHVADDERDAAIVAAIVGLARSLRIEVIAEGVETAGQLEFLKTIRSEPAKRLKCEKAQGYLFGKPVPAARATELFFERRK